MKKFFTIIFSFLFLFCLISCSKTKTDDNQVMDVNENNQINQEGNTAEEIDIGVEEETQNEVSVFPIWVESKETIKIRSGSSTSFDRIGYAKPGDKFMVFEQVENEGYTWNRIGRNEWIADDGSWLNRINGTTNGRQNLFSFTKLPNSIKTNYIEYSKDRVITTWFCEFEKDSSGNITGYNEIWNYDTEGSSDHPGDSYRFGTIQHPCYGKTTKHEYDAKGNIVKETLNTSYGGVMTKEFLYDESGKLVAIINYQSGYPSLNSAIVSRFDYEDNSIFEKQYWQDTELEEYYIYELNGNMAFQYMNSIDKNSGAILDDSRLYSFYRFDSDGDIIEVFDLNGDHCFIDFLYNY